MKVAIITVAGYQAGLMKDSPENKKELKAIYTEDNVAKNTYPSLSSSSEVCIRGSNYCIVGGYKFDCLESILVVNWSQPVSDKINLVFNKH